MEERERGRKRVGERFKVLTPNQKLATYVHGVFHSYTNHLASADNWYDDLKADTLKTVEVEL